MVIEGVESLHGCEYSVIADRIENRLLFGRRTHEPCGDVLVLNTSAEFYILYSKFEAMGATITTGHNWIRAVMTMRPKAVDIRTSELHPGFPTDMQAQLMAVCCLAEGTKHDY